MELDDIIDDLLEADSDAVAKHDTTYQRRAGPETTHSVGGEDTGTTDTKYHQHRERLAALAAGCRARQYLGKALSVDQVDNMEDEEVEKLYGRYEARLGAAMTKTLGAAALQLYTSVASMFLPIPPEEQPELLAELEADPFVEHAVSSATCEMYHRFGMYLAPVTAALTTLRHCRFEMVRIIWMIRIKMEADQTTPAQSAWVNTQTESTEGLERVTMPAPVPVAASPTAKSKDPKKVAAGRAGAAARKAKQESLLEELRAAKQSLQTEAVAEAATPVADVVPKEQPVAKQQPMPAPGDPGDPVKADWTPWILLVGAGLAALCVWRSPLVKLTERQQKQQHPEARSSGASQPPPTPRCAQHLKVPDDPFYMAWCAIMSSTPTQKNIVNDLYHAAVVGGLAIGYAKLGQMVFKGPLPRLDLTPRDAGMVVLDLSAAMATKDMLI